MEEKIIRDFNTVLHKGGGTKKGWKEKLMTMREKNLTPQIEE
jgi:hypothetical protein